MTIGQPSLGITFRNCPVATATAPSADAGPRPFGELLSTAAAAAYGRASR
jgi:hypothetical protein